MDRRCLDVLPPHLQWLLEEAPVFPVHSMNVHVITEPCEFYETLINLTRLSEKRIRIASLYLGNGKLEQKLVKTVDQQLRTNPQLSVSWLLDYMRGSRAPNSSMDMLRPLLSHERCQVSLYHTPELRGLLKWLLPQRFNEVVAVQHMKLYIFDDALLISGANLSADYFTQRQDRYILITDAAELCDFFERVVLAVAGHSFQLRTDGCLVLPNEVEHPYLGSKKNYCDAVEKDIKTIWRNEMEQSSRRLHRALSTQVSFKSFPSVDLPVYSEKSNFVLNSPLSSPSKLQASCRNLHNITKSEGACPPDTFLFPTLQMPSFKINYDSFITKKIFESTSKNIKLFLASGYFNFTKDYSECLLKNVKGSISILSAHPEANGFLNASGIAGAIPAVYTQLSKQFLDRVAETGQKHRITMSEYRKYGWTFHAKGLWYTEEQHLGCEPGNLETPSPLKKSLPNLTLIGSPNFGWRSVYRDLESQVVLVTRSVALQRDLDEERLNLFRYSSHVQRDKTFALADRYVHLWVRLVVPIIKKFF